jgi:ADP-ribose pyrophosphatase YjhB (NUDIX family)
MTFSLRSLAALARISKHLPIPRLGVRGVVLDSRRSVLLVRHTYVRGWYLPGGGVEKGETAEASLARELLEEAGVEIAERPHLHGFFFNPKASPRDYVACYVIRQFRHVARPAPNIEIAEAQFFPADQLPADATPATRARIEEVVRGEPVAELW